MSVFSLIYTEVCTILLCYVQLSVQIPCIAKSLFMRIQFTLVKHYFSVYM